MKTILVPLFNGHVARNIFQTSTYGILADNKNLQLIFVVSPDKVDYYQEQYGRDGVEFIKYAGKNIETDSRPEKLWALLLFHCVGTDTVFIRIKRNYLLHKSFLRWINYSLSTLVTKIFSRLDWLKRIFRYLYFVMLRVDPEIIRLVDVYKPALIYAPHAYDYNCIQFIKQGKIRKVKTMSTINSWDNLSNRGLLPMVPDMLIVHNQILVDEAIADHLINPEKIAISGLPHFDYYYNYQPSNKTEFYKKIGLDDTSKKLILFGAATANLKTPFGAVIRWLNEEIENDARLAGYMVLVRFYPNDNVDLESFVKQYGLENAKNILYSWPCANNFGGGKNWEFTKEDAIFLADSLFYSDALINYGSTLNIDIAAFDKSLLNMSFDGADEKNPNSVQWFYKRTHMEKLYSTGGMKLAKTYKELKDQLIFSLAHPESDREGRKAILDQQCWKCDGKAGARVANIIVSQIYV